MQKAGMIILGYFLGSVLFGEIFLKSIKKKDIREAGKDGNPGTFNAFAAGGMVCGILTLLCDMGKGILPVALYLKCNGRQTGDWMLTLVMAAPVLGHAFPVYKGFKGGGKAIAVSFGSLLGFFPDLVPALIPAAFYLIFSAFRIQPHGKRSILAYACTMILSLVLVKDLVVRFGMMLISVIVISKHLPELWENFTEVFLKTKSDRKN